MNTRVTHPDRYTEDMTAYTEGLINSVPMLTRMDESGCCGNVECQAEITDGVAQNESNISQTDLPFQLNRKIFVGNVGFRVGTRKLQGFFKKFGEVEYCYLVKDHIKKWSKGIAFITFKTEESCRKALQAPEDELYFENRQMRVKPAQISNRATYWQPSVADDGDNEKEVGVTESKSSPENVADGIRKVSDGSTEAPPHLSNMAVSENLSNTTHIDRLLDEILITIFSLLSWKERIAVERVCWRWKHLVQKSWITLKSLHFRNVFCRFKGLTDRTLNSVLLRCGSNLQSLDLSSSPRLLTDFSMDIIGKYCPDLQELNLSTVKVTNISLRNLASCCTQLKKVTMNSCPHITDTGLQHLLRNCPCLQHVCVEENISLTGQCFINAGEQLRHLCLKDCCTLNDSGIKHLAKRVANLEVLQINNCRSLGDPSLVDIGRNFASLRVLHIGGSLMTVSSSALAEIQKLKNLEDLDSSFNVYMSDNVLCAIGKSCLKLQKLDISGCHREVSDIGIMALCNIPTLHTVGISYLHLVTEASVHCLANQGRLHKVVARANKFMTDGVVKSLALFCTGLRHLDVSGCFQITNSIFEGFQDVTEPENNIELFLGGTCVEWVSDDIDWLAGFPHLKVSMHNLSIEQLRPDRELILPGEELWDDEEEDGEIDKHDHEYRPEFETKLPIGSDEIVHLSDQSTIADFESARLENCYDFDEEFSDGQDEFLDNDDPLAEERWNMS